MAKQKDQLPYLEAQGVELIDLVIERVRADPSCISSILEEPRPIPADILAHLTFPSGKPLPPSLKRWLAFDASWLDCEGWFASIEQGTFTPRRLDEIVTAEFRIWGEDYEPLSARMGECFLLPPYGSDSRHIYAVTDEDTLGEYPVIVIDVDDLPYAGVMYPGFDVYLAHEAEMISIGSNPQAVFRDPRYKTRMQHHADFLFNGEIDSQEGDANWDEGAGWDDEEEEGDME